MPTKPPDPATESPPLRTEIVTSQQARIDLLKYKLIAVATLGAIGLGFEAPENQSHIVFSPMYVLSVIPFICTFVDLLCWHNTLRILIIGRFLNSINDPYEHFLESLGVQVDLYDKSPRKRGARFFFELEDWALQWSSVTLSLALLAFGVHRISERHLWRDYTFVVAGASGAILPIIIWRLYMYRVKVLFELASKVSAKS